MNTIVALIATALPALTTMQGVRVVARVAGCFPNAAHTDCEDGRWEVYDVVRLIVHSPSQWSGDTLSVCIHPDDPDTWLRETGAACSFVFNGEIPVPQAGESVQLFKGALLKLERERPGDASRRSTCSLTSSSKYSEASPQEVCFSLSQAERLALTFPPVSPPTAMAPTRREGTPFSRHW